mgnify:CR=1 FL=1
MARFLRKIEFEIFFELIDGGDNRKCRTAKRLHTRKHEPTAVFIDNRFFNAEARAKPSEPRDGKQIFDAFGELAVVFGH